MSYRASKHVQAGHDLRERLFTRKRRAKICPVISDNLTQLAKGREINFVLGAKCHSGINLTLNILLNVILHGLRNTFGPHVSPCAAFSVSATKLRMLFSKQ